MKRIKMLMIVFSLLFFSTKAYADIVFPAIAHQFMVGMVVPSYYSVIMAVLILLIETFFIQKLFAINYIISFIVSFIVNLISSILGVFIVGFLELGTRYICMGLFGYSNMRLGTYLGMIPGYLLTVLCEAALLFQIALMIKKKVKTTECIKTSAIMNFLSYLIILIGVIIADIVTKGANFKTF